MANILVADIFVLRSQFHFKDPHVCKKEPQKNFVFLEVYPTEFIVMICYTQVNVTALPFLLQIIVVQFYRLLS